MPAFIITLTDALQGRQRIPRATKWVVYAGNASGALATLKAERPEQFVWNPKIDVEQQSNCAFRLTF